MVRDSADVRIIENLQPPSGSRLDWHIGTAPTVFDPDGRVLGFLETPAGLAIFEIGDDYILGLARDDLGVQSVQVWPLER